MKNILFIALLLVTVLLVSGCGRHYGMGGMERHFGNSVYIHGNILGKLAMSGFNGGQTHSYSMR